MLEHWLQVIGEFWRRSSAGVEALSKTHAGLLVFLGLLVAGLGVVLSGVQALLAYLGVVKHTRTPQDFLQPIDPSIRLDLIKKVETEWVHGRLHQGLRSAIRVDLNLTETLASVRPMLRIHTITESGQPEDRRIDDDILNIFERANGRLLILGEPGTGKTNLLMELAESLIAVAKTNPALPIPLVFSLPRWTLGDRVRTLADWLIDDLTDIAQYGVSRSTAHALIRQNRVTPLLDGLDEVAEGRRAACVEAIHAYQQERDLAKMAICCRIAEYGLLPKLNLRTAIRVEKLCQAEVERYISMDRLIKVRRALEGDPELWKIIDTPLWLHVAVLAAEVEPLDGGQAIPPRDRLYARFVNYALGRKEDGSPRKQTTTKLLTHWLGFLAAEMKMRAQSQFSFEALDGSWLPTKWASKSLATLTCGLPVGLIFGLIFGLMAGLAYGLAGGLGIGLGTGLAYGLLGLNFGFSAERHGSKEGIEELYFAWHNWRSELIHVLLKALGYGLVVGLFYGLALALVGGLIGGLVYGLDGMLQPKPVSGRFSPNRGTLRSLRYAVIVFLSGVALGIGVFAAFDSAMRSPTAGALFAGAGFVALHKGGFFAIRHYATRLLLWQYGVAPLRYVTFLNEAAERLFLMRQGGSYEFFHITFRDYMANTYGSKDSKP